MPAVNQEAGKGLVHPGNGTRARRDPVRGSTHCARPVGEVCAPRLPKRARRVGGRVPVDAGDEFEQGLVDAAELLGAQVG